ncbi:MAG: HD domain-containing protein [Microscillaceae bacterium]|nr:HD domain-containing protein [Microscillaceae bacterium]MDW8461268.1 HD domain-containing protein [Cytophagales bacterium]
MNKKKIINDPLYGFVQITSPLIFDIIQHPIFQRLRRIKQLGLAELVYPGALHTRFHHALGAMHLMTITLENLRSKGYTITEQEQEAAQIAILLHDVGHSPMSHALEYSLLHNIHHEEISLLLMQKLNAEMHQQLALALQIFQNQYSRKFLHQLISSQLDMDRLDYLQRDSFFTGVHEGTIGADRIIKMLALHNDELVVEEKGIYSIENFLHARRLMYWQVYLHKTNIASEQVLIQIFQRVRHLIAQKQPLQAMPNLQPFLEQRIDLELLSTQETYLQHYIQLDDYDIWASIKLWTRHPDRILATLCQMLLERKLFKITISMQPFDHAWIEQQKQIVLEKLTRKQLPVEALPYFFVLGSTHNKAYASTEEQIKILTKRGEVLDIAQASDLPTIKALRKMVTKYYCCTIA